MSVPNFRFLSCLEFVKKFLVVWWGVVEAHFSVQLKPKPSLTIRITTRIHKVGTAIYRGEEKNGSTG